MKQQKLPLVLRGSFFIRNERKYCMVWKGRRIPILDPELLEFV